MVKVAIKSEKLTPFGGIFSIMEKFDSMLSPVIDSTLGQRCLVALHLFGEHVGQFAVDGIEALQRGGLVACVVL